MLVLLYVALGFWDLGLSSSFQNSFFFIVNIILPKTLGFIFPSLQTNLSFSILQSCLDWILVTVIPFGIKSLKATSFYSYFDELFLYLYWIVAKSFAVDNLLLTLSFKISLGGLKSPSEIGLKDIQKFAKSGIITIHKTKIIVGKIKE